MGTISQFLVVTVQNVGLIDKGRARLSPSLAPTDSSQPRPVLCKESIAWSSLSWQTGMSAEERLTRESREERVRTTSTLLGWQCQFFIYIKQTERWILQPVLEEESYNVNRRRCWIDVSMSCTVLYREACQWTEPPTITLKLLRPTTVA